MIHTDFERGFIRAEVIAYDDFIALDGEAGAKAAKSKKKRKPKGKKAQAKVAKAKDAGVRVMTVADYRAHLESGAEPEAAGDASTA